MSTAIRRWRTAFKWLSVTLISCLVVLWPASILLSFFWISPNRDVAVSVARGAINLEWAEALCVTSVMHGLQPGLRCVAWYPDEGCSFLDVAGDGLRAMRWLPGASMTRTVPFAGNVELILPLWIPLFAFIVLGVGMRIRRHRAIIARLSFKCGFAGAMCALGLWVATLFVSLFWVSSSYRIVFGLSRGAIVVELGSEYCTTPTTRQLTSGGHCIPWSQYEHTSAWASLKYNMSSLSWIPGIFRGHPLLHGESRIVCPLWLVVFVCVLMLPIGRAVGSARGAGAACGRCSYDLTGNTSGICPECGTPVRSAGP